MHASYAGRAVPLSQADPVAAVGEIMTERVKPSARLLIIPLLRADSDVSQADPCPVDLAEICGIIQRCQDVVG
jgi:hypothetical protein